MGLFDLVSDWFEDAFDLGATKPPGDISDIGMAPEDVLAKEPTPLDAVPMPESTRQLLGQIDRDMGEASKMVQDVGGSTEYDPLIGHKIAQGIWNATPEQLAAMEAAGSAEIAGDEIRSSVHDQENSVTDRNAASRAIQDADRQAIHDASIQRAAEAALSRAKKYT